MNRAELTATAISRLPGADLALRGLADLGAGKRSEEALLVLIAGERLRSAGLNVPDAEEVPKPREHLLFAAVEARNPRGAHSEYNALLRRIDSFAHALSAFASPARVRVRGTSDRSDHGEGVSIPDR